MRSASEPRTERLQVRLDARAKATLRRAAGYSRESLSQFVLSTALDEADRIIRRHESVTLSDRDWDLFYEALTRPPAPNNRKLKAAFKRYGEAETRNGD